jgi:hypothetical protein
MTTKSDYLIENLVKSNLQYTCKLLPSSVSTKYEITFCVGIFLFTTFCVGDHGAPGFVP